MTEYDNTNSGALFKNQRKEADTHSDYNGNLNVGGTEYWINAWLKTSKKGEKYMSLSVKPKGQTKDHYDNYTDAMPGTDDLDVPF